MREFGAIPAAAKAPAEPAAPAARRRTRAAAPAPSRDNPAEVAIRLAHPAQQTGLAQRDLAYRYRSDAGPASITPSATRSACFPHNEPALVDAVLAALGAPPDFPIARPAFARRFDRQRLARRRARHAVPAHLLHHRRRAAAKGQGARSGEDPDGDAATLDVLAALEKFPGIRPDPEAFIEALDPLQPRLYSIASSPKAAPGRVALTVDTVRYAIGKRRGVGVASTFFAERIAPGAKIKAYIQKAQHFGLPADPSIADHHDRPRHRHRAVPRLPARAHGDQGARPQLAVLRPSAARLRLLLRGRTDSA